MNDGARRGHQGLLSIDFEHGQPPTLKKLGDALQGRLIHNQIGVEVFTQRMLGNVIFCGAQATCHDDDVASCRSFVERSCYFIRVIGYYDGAVHLNANRIQLFAQPSGIGINSLAYQQLITDGYNFRSYLLWMHFF
jgi:hypothetical protein